MASCRWSSRVASTFSSPTPRNVHAYDDFAEFAKRLGLVETRFRRIMETFIGKSRDVEAMIDASELSDECKGLYRDHVRDRVAALANSLAKLR